MTIFLLGLDGYEVYGDSEGNGLVIAQVDGPRNIVAENIINSIDGMKVPAGQVLRGTVTLDIATSDPYLCEAKVRSFYSNEHQVFSMGTKDFYWSDNGMLQICVPKLMSIVDTYHRRSMNFGVRFEVDLFDRPEWAIIHEGAQSMLLHALLHVLTNDMDIAGNGRRWTLIDPAVVGLWIHHLDHLESGIQLPQMGFDSWMVQITAVIESLNAVPKAVWN